VGWADLTDPGLGENLDVLKANPKFKGLRHLVESEPAEDWLVQPEVLLGLQTLAVHGVSYDLLVHTRHLKHARTVAESCPELRLVIDHLAKPPIRSGALIEWTQELETVATYPNVYCKLSGLVTEANLTSWGPEDLRPFIDSALEYFGPRRMMFGSDWPVCLLAASYDQVLECFRSLLEGLSELDHDAIFGGNSVEFYRLQEESAVNHG
jgi:L-fuconolactonase